MRTPLFLIVGFLLLRACALLGRLFSANNERATFAANTGCSDKFDKVATRIYGSPGGC